MLDRNPKHVIYYAPECEFCQALIENLQKTRAVHDFNAFDVTVASPPSYVTHVPTIMVLGTLMVGKDAFDWVDRLKYGGESAANESETETLEPGSIDASLETAGSFNPTLSEPRLVHTMTDPVTQQRSGIREEKITEGGINLDEIMRKRNEEIMMVPQIPTVANQTP